MCFIIEKQNSSPKIATEDIICYKIMEKRDGKWISLYKEFKYNPGDIYSQEMKHELIENEPSITEGLHSYSTLNSAVFVLESTILLLLTPLMCVVPCFIPKGAMYYQNSNNCYVSNQLIIGKDSIAEARSPFARFRGEYAQWGGILDTRGGGLIK